jgi:hypothetical protein
MGLLRSLATPAITNQPQSQPQPQPQPIVRAPRAIYDPLGISDDESSSVSSFLSPSLYTPSASSLSSDFIRQMNQLTIGLGRGNVDDDNLQYDPYGNEPIQDRFSDRSLSTA